MRHFVSEWGEIHHHLCSTSTCEGTVEVHPVQAFQVTAMEQLQQRWREITFSDMAPNTVILSSALGPRFRKQKFLTHEQVFNVQAKLPTQALGVRKEVDRQQHDSVCDQNSSSATVTSTITTDSGPTTPVSLLDLLPNSESSS